MSTAPVPSRTIPVAVLSTHCNINFLWEVMFELRHLVPLSCCPSGHGPLALDKQRDESLHVVSPLVNESALAESIVTLLIHTLADSIEVLASSLVR